MTNANKEPLNGRPHRARESSGSRHDGDTVTGPGKAVFLSYASQDAEAAQKLCNALRAAGIEVWFDQSELRGGDAWDQMIRRQVKSCYLFVPIISANSQSRKEGYFRREWKLAADRTNDMAEGIAFLLPVVIDDTSDTEALVPEKFREVQWTRLPGGGNADAFVEHVHRLLSPEATAPAATKVTQSVRHEPSTGVASLRSTRPASHSIVPWVVGSLLILATGYLLADKFLFPKHAVPAATAPPNGPAPAPAIQAIPEKSVAVLPFVDLSEKHDQEYFADGMAEEILNLLVKLPDLKVIGRTSSFQFKGKTEDLRKIGTILAAAFVVEGSVRRSGDHMRVTAQLIDTRDGTHRWSETYDRNADDAMKVQEQIAASLVRALELEVSPSIAFGLRSKPKEREAYDIYLRGLHAADKFTLDGWEEAVADFRRVLQLDSSFVPAAEALTESLMFQAGFAFVPEQTGWQQVREAAEATLKLDPKSGIAHAALANVYLYQWDWIAAERELNIALVLAPNDPSVLVYAADERLIVGQWAQAVHLLDAARAVDPLRPSVYEWSCWVYPMLGRLPEAEKACRRALEISPTYVGGAYNLGVTLLVQGKAEDALTEMLKADDPADQLAGLALAYHALHRNSDAEAALARLAAEHAEDTPMAVADVYAFRGQNDQALQWLDTAYTRRDHTLVYLKSDLLLKNLVHDPHYKALLRKMSLPE
ncbi:MAG: TIR domain-containing protein [Steroidobacteraceae bacterium]